MKRIVLISLQIYLFTLLYSGMTEVLKAKNDTPFIGRATNFHKALRQGDPDDADEENKTEPPPKQNCVCSQIYDPVCASNNESYYNLCLLECRVPKTENVTVVHQGNCIPF